MTCQYRYYGPGQGPSENSRTCGMPCGEKYCSAHAHTYHSSAAQARQEFYVHPTCAGLEALDDKDVFDELVLANTYPQDCPDCGTPMVCVAVGSSTTTWECQQCHPGFTEASLTM